MNKSDSRREPAANRLPAWFDRTERVIKIALFVLLFALILFQFMPFSPAIRDVFCGFDRVEGVPYDS